MRLLRARAQAQANHTTSKKENPMAYFMYSYWSEGAAFWASSLWKGFIANAQ